MAKKPKLTLIDPTAPAPNPMAPPANLGEAGRKLWQEIMREYQIEDSGGVETLMQICTAADRAADCAERIAEDGSVIRTKAGLREHPLLKIELASRSFVVRSLHRLGLEIVPPRASIGRPSGTFNPVR